MIFLFVEPIMFFTGGIFPKHFPKDDFPSDNCPSGNFPKGLVRPSEVGQAAMGASAEARMGQGAQFCCQNKIGAACCNKDSLGKLCFGKLHIWEVATIVKIPQGKYLTSQNNIHFKLRTNFSSLMLFDCFFYISK